jgi:GNAT superfamily N-acetyltransferase
MHPYYKWDPEKGEFVAVAPETRKEPLPTAYRVAVDRDRAMILDFEAEYEKTESQAFLQATGFDDFRTGLWSIDLKKTGASAVVLALTGNSVVGELSMSCYHNTAEGVKLGLIRGLCVLARYRGAGIGRGLFELAKGVFQEWGVKRIEIMYGLRNLADQEFCRRLGFEVTHAGQAIYRLE